MIKLIGEGQLPKIFVHYQSKITLNQDESVVVAAIVVVAIVVVAVCHYR